MHVERGQQYRAKVDVSVICMTWAAPFTGGYERVLPKGETIVIAISYGEPQYEDNVNIFVRSRQVDVGLDFERPLSGQSSWLSAYVTASAGWRNERLIGANTLAGETSDSVNRAVLSLGTGLRIDAINLGERSNFRIQLGLVGRQPLQDAELQFGATTFRVQKPALDFLLGMTFDFE